MATVRPMDISAECDPSYPAKRAAVDTAYRPPGLYIKKIQNAPPSLPLITGLTGGLRIPLHTAPILAPCAPIAPPQIPPEKVFVLCDPSPASQPRVPFQVPTATATTAATATTTTGPVIDLEANENLDMSVEKIEHLSLNYSADSCGALSNAALSPAMAANIAATFTQPLLSPSFNFGAPLLNVMENAWTVTTARKPLPIGVRDIDESHTNDIFYATEYVQDIMEHLYQEEVKKQPLHNYMEVVQKEILPNMRAILVDWLIDVSDEFKSTSETLYMAIGLIDRYLSSEVVSRRFLQLVGITCFFIAAKFDEIYPPRVTDMAYMTDNTYSTDEILKLEVRILNMLKFEVSMPSSRYFLRRFILAKGLCQQGSLIASYICDLSLIEYGMLSHKPSCVAASCVALAALFCNMEPWDPTMVYYTQYRLSDLKTCIHRLCSVMVNIHNSKLVAIKNKFIRSGAAFATELKPTPELLTKLEQAMF
eukprot:TRINITY_DN11522_c0_g3_i2.p1 TRINITY_DN11522_c0_g3~~TRINITY_DN11522_c0_g3_i2.p1  ORF type:complete len:479 (-),score=85.72 TRINITY_DN11522_c0_g3_i2:544-1980(-)